MSPASLNQSLFLWLNPACAALPDWFWSSLTVTGHTSVLFALLAPLLLPQFKRADTITALFATALIGGLVSTLVKESLRIPRPPAVLMPEQFLLIGHKLELVSFPSGHSLSVFAVATLLILSLQWRGWRLAGVLLLASLVGLSRIAVGAHWPLDVLGGAVLGGACGLSGWWVAKQLHRQSWAQSVMYPLCQIVIILLVSLSLFITHTGYPAAWLWQNVTAVSGVVFSTYSLILLIKSFKSS